MGTHSTIDGIGTTPPDLPRLLIVTPTLGQSRYLDATMQSAASLGLPVTHVLSAPKPRLEELSQRYPQAIVVSDAGREGAIYGAINTALAAAPSGWEWFTYINDDDELSPGFSQVYRQHTAKANPEPVTYGRVELIDEAGASLGYLTTERSPKHIPAALKIGISPLNQQGMLFHRSTIERLGNFDLRYRICADLDFWARAYAAGFAFRYYPVRVAAFRIRRGQISGDVSLTRTEQEEIVGRAFPQAFNPLERLFARARYRLQNLPRYLARLRTLGWKSSNQILAEGGRAST